MFLKIFQVSTNKEMVNKLNSSSFSTRNLFQIRACVISTQKAKHLDVTNIFTHSHANTSLGQSGHVYYLSYFIKYYIIQSRDWGAQLFQLGDLKTCARDEGCWGGGRESLGASSPTKFLNQEGWKWYFQHSR